MATGCRLRAKPGITGLWQVSGRDDSDWEQAVRLDLYYVENWSPVQDFVIMLRTVKAVVAEEGEHRPRDVAPCSAVAPSIASTPAWTVATVRPHTTHREGASARTSAM